MSKKKTNKKPGKSPEEEAQPDIARRPLHRLSEVRIIQGVRRKTLMKALGLTSEAEVKAQEDPYADLSLSQLYVWQRTLGVPLSELLCEPDEGLSRQVASRADLVRIMKTAKAIAEQARSNTIRRFAETLCQQLIDMMPELADINPWPTAGSRRKPSKEMSQTELHRIDTSGWPHYEE
jgi:hypothetical protein